MAKAARGPITHAGGVVRRIDGPDVRYLLVSAKRQPDLWVLPKGHVDPGETPEQTAAREVLEEAGVIASPVSGLGVVEFHTVRGHVRAEFFLMRYEGDGRAAEERRVAWMTAGDAIGALGFENMRRLVRAADRVAHDTA